MDTRKIATEYRMSHWSQVMRERRESGLSIKAFCKEAGFHENVYYYWRRKLREAACEQMPDLQAETGQTDLAVSGFTEVHLAEVPPHPALPETPGHLRIEVGGMLITAESGYPPSMLAALLRELRDLC